MLELESMQSSPIWVAKVLTVIAVSMYTCLYIQSKMMPILPCLNKDLVIQYKICMWPFFDILKQSVY